VRQDLALAKTLQDAGQFSQAEAVLRRLGDYLL
jgi:Flp pilus assembly protein TadD